MDDEIRGKRLLVDAIAPPREDLDRTIARRAAHLLRGLDDHAELIVRTRSGRFESVPRGFAQLVASMLEEAAKGNTVALVSEGEEVSTSTAAEFLGVSRPHVVKLIDSGMLPCRMAGSHRRVRMTELVAYKRVVDRRHAFLDEMTADSNEMGLYDLPPLEPRR